MKIRRLLVANRGEIAVRIIRTARRLDIHSIAVYSNVDKNALHVMAADEAVLLGDAPPAESYLNIDKIIEAAKSSHADAIHTGYGFLAENPEFARRCADNDLVFIGPSASAIEAMGLKGVAKTKMERAGVPVLPGINQVASDDIAESVKAIGYPVLVKPEAGGGGKGMKIVYDEAELQPALESARREAGSSFGNDRLMVEKYLVAPRHIEIQIFADAHGNCIHLNERDCSLQRRHQKIIEESPAPLFDPDLRRAMGRAAVAAAGAIDYVGAGTVEFLLAPDGHFYFMEMNTRLQVEHPVTEAVTGFDLVEWQLAVASGDPLPVTQEDVPLRGHAIEARLYAEDPLNGFLPASGQIRYLELPSMPDVLRIDNGVAAGDLIGVFYDPMLMKLIAHGDDRKAATAILREGLERLHLAGIATNRDFLLAVLRNQAFHDATISTDWLDRNLDETFRDPDRHELHLAICGAIVYLLNHAGNTDPWSTAHNFRLNQSDQGNLLLLTGGEEHWTSVTAKGEILDVEAAGKTSRCRLEAGDPLTFSANGETYQYKIVRNGTGLAVFTPRRFIELQLPDDISLSQTDEQGGVHAPLSGKIVSVLVNEGDHVAKGTPLVTIEAMKMEHTVYAPAHGTVASIFFVEQDLVNEGTELLEFVGDEGDDA